MVILGVSILLGLSTYIIKLWIFSPVNLSHINLILRPMRRTLTGRRKFFIPNITTYSLFTILKFHLFVSKWLFNYPTQCTFFSSRILVGISEAFSILLINALCSENLLFWLSTETYVAGSQTSRAFTFMYFRVLLLHLSH